MEEPKKKVFIKKPLSIPIEDFPKVGHDLPFLPCLVWEVYKRQN